MLRSSNSYGCKADSVINTVQIIINHLDSKTDNNKTIHFYPIPGSGIFHFDNLTIRGNVEIDVFDNTGNLIHNEERTLIPGNTETIKLNKFKPGVYICKIHFENNTYHGRIIIAD